MKKQKKRIIKTPKRIAGFLPLLFPLFGALGSLEGGAAGIAKAVNDAKANSYWKKHSDTTKLWRRKGKDCMLNRIGVVGYILHHIKKLPIKLPRLALTNKELVRYVKLLKIPYFRGVFMHNTLPVKIHKIECAIINLDNEENVGSHWTCYVKENSEINYFDSYGNLRPPKELLYLLYYLKELRRYFKSDGSNNVVKYDYETKQADNLYNCRHLYLKFLYNYY